MRLPSQLLSALIVFTLVVSGCDKKQSTESAMDSMMEEMLSTTEAMAAELKTVTDAASADAAKPKLIELRKKLLDLETKTKSMEKPSREAEDATKKKYEQRLSAAFGGMMSEAMRLGQSSDPKLSSLLKEVDQAAGVK